MRGFRVSALTASVLVLAGCTSSGPSERAGEARAGYYFETGRPEPCVAENSFLTEEVTTRALPDAAAWGREVPRVVWDGHPDEVAAFASAWRMVGEKLHRPEPGTNFKRNFVYTPFGKSVFVWGSCFITMYGAYASNVFPFIEQLDNFYAAQAKDGFIPRQLGIFDGRSQFAPQDLSSAGGNIFAWAELEWARMSGDTSRLKRVYPVLLAYHRWFRKNRTWKDGTYFSSGWGSGMDNVPRMDEVRYAAAFDHGFLSWVDVTMQQILDAKCLVEIARLADIPPHPELPDEIVRLTRLANERMWDEELGLYCDLDRDGNRVKVRHIGGFWALLADVAPPERAKRLAATLAADAFAAPCGTRSLAKGEAGYEPDGGNYWRGGVWCITDWMCVRGLEQAGETEAAHALAKRQVGAVAKVFAETGTIWESYDPERFAPGKVYGESVRRDFVGFSGVTPIAMLIRDVFGISVSPGKIEWKVRLLERHGVENLTLPDGNIVSLVCAARSSAAEKPIVEIKSLRPIDLLIH